MRLTGEIMKIITCFKLVPEEQDIVVTPEYTLNFDNADAKISQFDLNAIEAASPVQIVATSQLMNCMVSYIPRPA